ncbi:MAG: glycosyltransferase [Cupriavidus sp.]|nr:glycosyltransferase [Cupriavidus sp.]
MSIRISEKPDTARKRVACVIALSDIPNDPRVRRQCDALLDAGWDVVAVGVPGTDDPSVRWPIKVRGEPVAAVGADGAPSGLAKAEAVAEAPVSRPNPLKQKVKQIVGPRAWKLLGKIRHRLEARPTTLFKLYFKPEFAEAVYWSWPNIQQLEAAASTVKADLWLANDWTALPIAARMAERDGAVYVYDSHEFAVDEYAQRLRWRLINRPIVRQVERRYIANAKVISTVSSGIADALEKLYKLPEKPAVIRNAPQFSQSDFRPTGDAIRLLYHGIVAPGRGLEETIASVPDWREEYTLFIRGPGDEYYLAGLRNQIRSLGLESRVIMLPPVPMIDLVPQARDFDVGFFALKAHSLQNHYVLPNKFFEYTMAGLALCVSDLREMTRLCDKYGHGVVFKGLSKETIAATVNGLTRENIDRMKHKAIKASEELCWSNEAARMLHLYNELVAG